MQERLVFSTSKNSPLITTLFFDFRFQTSHLECILYTAVRISFTTALLELDAWRTQHCSRFRYVAYSYIGGCLPHIKGLTWTSGSLLGFSAFAGTVVLLAGRKLVTHSLLLCSTSRVGWPINRFLSKRAIWITEGVSNARDKRMAVLNGLISTVRDY